MPLRGALRGPGLVAANCATNSAFAGCARSDAKTAQGCKDLRLYACSKRVPRYSYRKEVAIRICFLCFLHVNSAGRRVYGVGRPFSTRIFYLDRANRYVPFKTKRRGTISRWENRQPAPLPARSLKKNGSEVPLRGVSASQAKIRYSQLKFRSSDFSINFLFAAEWY